MIIIKYILLSEYNFILRFWHFYFPNVCLNIFCKAISLSLCVCLLCQRLHVFLFEQALVLSRPGEDKDGGQVFNVYRQPLRNALLNLEEIPDGEAGGSSFRGAFTGGNDKGNICYINHMKTWCRSNFLVYACMTYILFVTLFWVKFRLLQLTLPCRSTPLAEVKPTISCTQYPSLFCLSFPLLVKNCFRVSSRGRSKAYSYSLQANDSFSKQQWITSLRQAIVQMRDKKAQSSQPQPPPHADTPLHHMSYLTINSDTEMVDQDSHWLSDWSSGGLWSAYIFVHWRQKT